MTGKEIAMMRTRAAILIAANMDSDPESRSRSRAEVERIERAIEQEQRSPSGRDPIGKQELDDAYKIGVALFARIFHAEEDEQSPAVVWEPTKKGEA